METPVLPTPKAAAAASWKALARLPDAPPLCQPTNSPSVRVPVASLHEWLSVLSTNAPTKSSDSSSASSGPLVPALGPTDCAAIANHATECTASIGCEFCLLGAGEKPFCAPMGVCFGGVVGGVSPYTSITSASTAFSAIADTPRQSPSTKLIISIVVVLFVFIVLIFII